MHLRSYIALTLTLTLLPLLALGQQCGVYTGAVFKDGFGPPDPSFSQEPELTLPADTTTLALTITSPTNKTVVGTRTLEVYGTYAGPPATGIAINKNPVVQTASQYVGLVVLKPGTNTITVKATKLTGETETLTRTVTYDAAALPDVSLETKIQGEHAPIKAGFVLKTKSGLTVTRLQVDYDGDGTFELDTPNGSSTLAYEYKIPGFYTASATVTLDDGNVNTPLAVSTATRKMAIVPLPLTRQTLCYVFYRMKDRLAANDIPGSLKSVNPDLRSEVQADFEELGDPADGAERMGIVTDGTLGIRIAYLTLAVTYNNQPISTSITFERASDGVWRITSL